MKLYLPNWVIAQHPQTPPTASRVFRAFHLSKIMKMSLIGKSGGVGSLMTVIE